MPAIKLSAIPTLRASYKNLKIQNSQLRTEVRPEILDHVSLFQGDITKLEVDAIVNAAKKSLLGGGGIDGAIHRAAGRELLKECSTLNGAQTGEAKITKGYNLPSKHVIHAVGPVYSNSRVETVSKQLALCYSASLDLAVKNSLKSIAFCAISTGVYGYPIKDATHIALKATREHIDALGDDYKFDRVVFVVYSDIDKDVYEELLPLYFPPEVGMKDNK